MSILEEVHCITICYFFSFFYIHCFCQKYFIQNWHMMSQSPWHQCNRFWINRVLCFSMLCHFNLSNNASWTNIMNTTIYHILDDLTDHNKLKTFYQLRSIRVFVLWTETLLKLNISCVLMGKNLSHFVEVT